MTKILVTGFNPFNHEKINPAIEAVKLLPEEIAGCEIIKLQLPTSYQKSEKKLQAAVEREEPDFVLSVGQAGGRACLTPELVAINYDDCPVADMTGKSGKDRRLIRRAQRLTLPSCRLRKWSKLLKRRASRLKCRPRPAALSATMSCITRRA